MLWKFCGKMWSSSLKSFSLTNVWICWKNVCCTAKLTPLIALLHCFPLCLVFQSATIDCKLTAAADKTFDKSPTKTRQPRKVDLRARYWAFLFDNLRRAVDEIYVTCESDQSVVECKVSLSSSLPVVTWLLSQARAWSFRNMLLCDFYLVWRLLNRRTDSVFLQI